MDATSDRDFALEFVSVLAMLGVHLSRWAEEFILFATQEYGFITLPEAYSTGSSAMPQKQNPDALELIRGKSARTHRQPGGIAHGVKGLPLAYNKDMQETQEPLFEAVSTAGALPEGGRGLHAPGEVQPGTHAVGLRTRIHECHGGGHVSGKARRAFPPGA